MRRLNRADGVSYSSFKDNERSHLKNYLLFFICLLTSFSVSALNINSTLESHQKDSDGRLLYKVMVSNTDSTARTGVRLDLSIPNGWAFRYTESNINASGCSTCSSGDAPYWELGTLEAGDSIELIIPFYANNLANYFGSDLAFTATVSRSGSASTDSHSVSSAAIATQPVHLSISPDNKVVGPGERVNFTVTYGNVGVTGYVGQYISAKIPSGATFISASDGGYLDGNSVIWNTSDVLNIGQSEVRTFTVQLPASSNGSIYTADVSWAQNSSSQPLQRSTEAVVIGNTSELGLSVATTGGFNTGTMGTVHRFVISNHGSVTRSSLKLKAMTGSGSYLASYESMPSFYGNYYVGDWFTIDLPSLAPGDSTVVTLPVRPYSGVKDGAPLVAEAFIFDDAESFIQAVRPTVRYDETEALALSINSTKQSVIADEPFEYEVAVGNLRATAYQNLEIVAELPSEVTIVLAEGGVISGNTITWNISTLNAGTSLKRTVKVVSAEELTSGTQLKANVSAQYSSKTINAGSEIVNVVDDNELQLNVAISSDKRANYTMTWMRYVVSNSSLLAKTDVQLKLLLPIGTRLESYESLPSFYGNQYYGDWITYDLGQINPGESKAITIPLRRYNQLDGQVWNVRAVVSDAGNDFVQGTVPTLTNDDNNMLVSTLVASKEVVGAGESFSYEVVIANPSATANQNVDAILEVPQNYIVSEISDGGVQDGQYISWDVGTINGGSSTKRFVEITVPEGLVDGTTRKATLTTQVSEETVSHSTVVSVIDNDRDLEMYVAVTGDVSTPDQFTYYRYVVTNNGLLSRTDVKLNVSMAGWTYLGSYESLPSFYGNQYLGDWITYDLGQLDPGDSRVVVIPVRKSNAEDGMFFDSQAILADGSSNFIQAMRPTVTYDTSLGLASSISANKQVAEAGGELEYEVTFANMAASAAQNVLLSVDVPDAITVDEISDNGYLSGGKIYWEVGTVNAQNDGKRYFTAQTSGDLAEGDVIFVKSFLGQGGETISTGSEAVVVKSDVGLHLSVATNGATYFANTEENTRYRYVISNNGTVAKTNIKVTLSPGLGSRVYPNDGAPGSSSSAVYATDWLTYEYDELLPGESRSIYLPIYAYNAVAGAPWVSHVFVSDQSNSFTLGTKPTVLRGSEYSGLQPVVNIESNQVIKQPGSDVSFKVAVGNPSNTTLENGMMMVEIPDGMQFKNASGLNKAIGNKVYWPVGNVPSGTWREESLTLSVSNSVSDGDLLRPTIKLLNTSNLGPVSLASEIIVVQESPSLSATISTNYSVPMGANSLYMLDMDISNLSGVQIADVMLRSQPGRNSDATGSEHPLASCSGGSTCYEDDWLNFDLGNMAAGALSEMSSSFYLRSGSYEPEGGQLISASVWLAQSSKPSADIVMTSTIGVGPIFDVDGQHDSDGDGIPDYWELQYSEYANWLDPNDADNDADGDGYTNLEEFQNGLSPYNRDPKDSDGDRLYDSVELALGLDPNSDDTDEDGIIDRLDNRPTEYSYSQSGLLTILHPGDVNGDGADDIAVVSVSDSELPDEVAIHAGIVTVDILNTADLSLINRTKWPTAYQDVQVYLLEDSDGNGAKNIGVFGMYLTVEDDETVIKPQLYVRDALTSARIEIYNWPANWLETEIEVLEDMTSDGMQDVALEGRFIVEDARPQLVVKDGMSGDTVMTYSYPSLFDKPGYVQLSDFNGDGVREIGLFGTLLRNDKYQIKITDGTDPEGKMPAYNYPDFWTGNSWHQLSDIDGDGEKDWGMFGVRKDDNRPQLLTKSGTNIVGSLGIFAWPEDFNEATFHIVPDITGDGVDEVASAGYRGSQDRNQFIVKDGADRSVIFANIGWPNKWTQISYHVLGDLNNNGHAEVALYGLRSTGVWELNIKDTATDEYGVFVLGNDWLTKPEITVVDDIDGNGHKQVLVYGHDSQGLSKMEYIAN